MKANNRILVVDDEAGLRTSLAANLELEGYQVVEAGDGPTALALVRESSFDLVITDVRMPGMSGVDVFREIRKTLPDLPVVLMTAYAVEKLLSDALGEGVYAVLAKPFAVDHVLELIAHVVAGPVVLVVDDRAEQAAGIVEGLRLVGIAARAAPDGETAVRLIGEENIDVCVLDLVMPGMDGVKTFEEIHRLDPRISVIAVSGHTVPQMMHALMSMGGYACLRKPFHMPELTRAIARARGEVRHEARR
jgi:two-component system response regulator HydG